MTPVQIFWSERKERFKERIAGSPSGANRWRFVRLLTLHCPNNKNINLKIYSWLDTEVVELHFFNEKIPGQLSNPFYSIVSSPQRKNAYQTGFSFVLGSKERHSLGEEEAALLSFLESKGIHIIEPASNHSYTAQLLYNSYDQIIAVSKVLICLKEWARSVEKSIEPPPSGSHNASSSTIYSWLLFLVIFAGCFTCSTRKRDGAICGDGSQSSATGSGACSHHAGVRRWTHIYWWDW